MSHFEQEYARWVAHLKSQPHYAQELAAIKDDPEEMEDRFGRPLAFGTGGMRGVMGLGTNRVNLYTIGQASQGLADYLCGQRPGAKVAIAYDSRTNSREYAWEAAGIMARAGITVYIFRELMPTPALSYAVREYGCDAGIVVTASHNPAQFNGYKVYGRDGSQIKPDVTEAVIACIRKVDLFSGIRRMQPKEAMARNRVYLIPDAFLYQYIEQVFDEMVDCAACANTGLVVAYTPLNGAGNRCVRAALEEAGVQDIHVVPEQEQPDGAFPTCPKPNPEEAEALALGLALARKTGADILLATDPDADRVAVAVRHRNEYRILTGNEVGVLLLNYICTARKQNGRMPENPVAMRSVVSAKMADLIAQAHGVEMRVVPTGFKYVGEVIRDLEMSGEAGRFIFGFEESCGYLCGGYVRDKDAVSACLLIAEMACVYKRQSKTLVDVLAELYANYGYHRDYSDKFEFDGPGAAGAIDCVMAWFRAHPPRDIGGLTVVGFTDYLTGPPAPFPPSNMLELQMDNGSSIIMRPSGTEAKIKVYYSITPAPDPAEVFRHYHHAIGANVRHAVKSCHKKNMQ